MMNVGSGVRQQIQRLFALGSLTGLTDWELLRRYVDRRDEVAFESLVNLHGPMVLATCRRMLDSLADVEDAFQATFLVLVRKAGSLRPTDAIGPWLYGVAHRIALRIRTDKAKHRSRERSVERVPAEVPAGGDGMADLSEIRPLLDRELGRLPESYRAAIVLCYLEGRTHEEAALHLGWPLGTLKGRLARARELLKGRLTRRGVTLSTSLLTAIFAREAEAAVPPTWVEIINKAARVAATGESAVGLFSASSVALAEGVFRAMKIQRIKTIAAATTMLLAFTAGAGAVLQQNGSPAPNAQRSNPGKPSAQIPSSRGASVVAPAEKPARVVLASNAPGDEISVEALPPVVVQSTPVSGSSDVDPALTEIKVTFSKPMTDGSWSWSQLSDASFPKIQGKPKYDAAKRTCSVSVKLEPGKTYAIWLNSNRFHNFKDADGHPAVPYLLVFKTKG